MFKRMFKRKSKATPMSMTERLDKLNLPRHIREHIDVKRAEVQDTRGIGLLIQHLFALAGVGGAGFVTVHLLTEKGGLPIPIAILIAVMLDAFTIMAAELVTRSRLRGETAWTTRVLMYLGAAASITLNIMFPFNEVLLYAIPAAIVLGTLSWVKGVRDKYAAIFVALDLVTKERRAQRWSRVRKFFAYLFAVGLFGRAEKRDKNTGEIVRPATIGAIGAFRQRAGQLGATERDVQHHLALTRLSAKQEIGEAEVAAEVEAAIEPVRRGPFPPHQNRPISAQPAQVVTGDDDLADFFRGTADRTDAARQLMSAWYANYQQNLPDLFNVPFSVVSSATALSRLLVDYGFDPLNPSTISNEKSKLIRSGHFPDRDEAKSITGIVDGSVVVDAITAG